jgi:hypothetical protein
MHRLAPAAGFALSLLLVGCAMGPRVVPAGPQTYTVSSDGGLNLTTATSPAREAVFRAANRFCIKRKLVMVPVSLDEHPGQFGERLPSADLIFRALPPGDPQIARAQAIFRHYDPMVVRESVIKFTADPADQPRRTTGTPHP